MRLTPRAYDLGIVSDERLKYVERKEEETEKMLQFLRNTSYDFSQMNDLLKEKKTAVVTQDDKYFKVFSRPQVELTDIRRFDDVENYIQGNDLNDDILEQVEVQVKYSGYIAKEKNNADKLNRLEDVKIPSNFDFSNIQSISIEARQKLKAVQPVTISQASRISGVNPSDISVLLVHMGR
jgi:tRNA uridine 5-carboxymethylaminomethyl modification enzyme